MFLAPRGTGGGQHFGARRHQTEQAPRGLAHCEIRRAGQQRIPMMRRLSSMGQQVRDHTVRIRQICGRGEGAGHAQISIRGTGFYLKSGCELQLSRATLGDFTP